MLGPTVAEEEFGGTGFYGVLAAALGAGTIGGALIGLRWRPERPMLMALVCNLPWPAAIALFAAGAPRPFLVALFVLAGVGLALFDVWWQTALAQRIPPHALSRVSSYDWMGSLALLPLGYLLAGPGGRGVRRHRGPDRRRRSSAWRSPRSGSRSPTSGACAGFLQPDRVSVATCGER